MNWGESENQQITPFSMIDHELVGQTVAFPLMAELPNGNQIPVHWAFGTVKEVFMDVDIPDEPGNRDLAQIVDTQGFPRDYMDVSVRPDVVDEDEIFIPVEQCMVQLFGISRCNIPLLGVN